MLLDDSAYSGDPQTPPPASAPAPANPAGEPLLARIRGALGNIGSSMMPADGMAATLSPEQVASERRSGLIRGALSMLAQTNGQNGGPAPGVFQALGNAGADAQDAYKSGVQEQLQGRQYAMGQAMLQRQMAARNEIAQQFAPVPNETTAAEAQRHGNAAAAYANVGLIDEANTEAKIAQALHQRLAMAGHVITDANDKQWVFNPLTGTVVPLGVPGGGQMTSNQPTEADRTASRGLTADSHDLGYAKAFATGPAKPYLDKALSLTRAASTLQALGSPDADTRTAALSSVAGVVASFEPQKPQLRAQLYGKLSTIDPSFTGQTASAFMRYIYGQPVAKQQAMLGKYFNIVAQGDRAGYTRLYQPAYNARGSAQQYMKQYDPATIYGNLGVPDTTGSASNVDKFLGR